MSVKPYAEKLVLLRGKKSRSEVAEKLKISKSALAMYETGQRVPRDEVKIALAQFYGKTVEEIFFTN